MIPSWLYTTRWLILDTETTGLDPASDRVVQLAAIQVDPSADGKGHAFGDCINTVLNPGRPIPEASTKIHGIADQDTAGKPTFAELAPRLLYLARGRQVVGYNVRFDLSMLRTELQRAGHPTGNAEPADPLVWIRHIDRFVRGSGRHKLAAACERWGVGMTKAHDAGSDAIAAWDLWVRLVEREHAMFPETLPEMLAKQRVMARDQEADFQRWLAAQGAREAG